MYEIEVTGLTVTVLGIALTRRPENDDEWDNSRAAKKALPVRFETKAVGDGSGRANVLCLTDLKPHEVRKVRLEDAWLKYLESAFEKARTLPAAQGGMYGSLDDDNVIAARDALKAKKKVEPEVKA